MLWLRISWRRVYAAATHAILRSQRQKAAQTTLPATALYDGAPHTTPQWESEPAEATSSADGQIHHGLASFPAADDA